MTFHITDFAPRFDFIVGEPWPREHKVVLDYKWVATTGRKRQRTFLCLSRLTSKIRSNPRETEDSVPLNTAQGKGLGWAKVVESQRGRILRYLCPQKGHDAIVAFVDIASRIVHFNSLAFRRNNSRIECKLICFMGQASSCVRFLRSWCLI